MKILEWYNSSNLKFQDKINILLISLANVKKDSIEYKQIKDLLKLIDNYK